MSINNLKLIKPLLNFEKEGDFYMLYIFKRKKDQPEGEKDNHQSVRTIRSYVVESVEYLEKRWDEITHLCEYFKARAYIHVQKQNHKDVGLNMLAELANKIRDGVYKFNNLFDSVVGQLKTHEKRWVVDVDSEDDLYRINIVAAIDACDPIEIKPYTVEYEGKIYPAEEHISKVIEEIPTKNGFHLITKPFNVEQFKKYLNFGGIIIPDIQKKNPTLLYLPESLTS